jgi:3-oxoacyl-[acyl-carrier protein] reductase
VLAERILSLVDAARAEAGQGPGPRALTRPTQKGRTIMNYRDSKVALVTGASRGIGAAIARRLASDGFAVVVNYAGQASAAEALVQEIREGGGRAVALAADVSRSEDVKRLFDAAEQQFGGVDVLVNNAGIMSLAPIAEMDDETFDALVSINLKGTFNTLREAGRRLRRGGRVINLSSSVIGLQLPTYAPYAATKAGVEALGVVFAKEMRGRQISVNAVAPGPTATRLFLDGKSEELIARMSQQAPLERLGQPDDIAGVVAFLAGPDGQWVNGQTLRVNGGVI